MVGRRRQHHRESSGRLDESSIRAPNSCIAFVYNLFGKINLAKFGFEWKTVLLFFVAVKKMFLSYEYILILKIKTTFFILSDM